MTRLSEERAPAEDAEPIAGPGWRAEVHAAQKSVLPAGSVALSCPAVPGAGGLGRHLSEIVDALARRGAGTVCVYGTEDPARRAVRRRGPATRALRSLLSLSPPRQDAARRTLQQSVEFDDDCARRLPAAEHLIAFNGVAAEQLRAARAAGYASASIVSATAHIKHVIRQYERAHRLHPLEGSWATRIVERTLIEYSLADRVFVSSHYVRDSFVEEGFDAEQLPLFPLSPDPRYSAGAARDAAGTFDIVYVGGLSVVKGVPLLVDAVRALPHGDIRLHLVGGWSSRGVRRFLERAVARDPRIQVVQGDPLPHLQTARLYVHPSYSDGFGYAPVEALACGVPVIVSEDTGMKDLLESRPASGHVVATGERELLSEAIDAAYRGELFGPRTAG